MSKRPFFSILILALAIGLGYFVYTTETKPESRFKFKLGLDLSGGTHLVYKADTHTLAAADVTSSMESLRDVIERRVNLFGVSEPVVQIEKGASGENRLAVELPGVTNIQDAVGLIGTTPVLEFKTERASSTTNAILIAQKSGQRLAEDPYFEETPLTGRFLKKASLEFSQSSFGPIVALEFNDDGTRLFAQLTKENINKTIAIYLDGAPISIPVVREEIPSGKAQITGTFSLEEAKTLVGRLNAGALPVPIDLISTQSVGASLGDRVLADDVRAGLYGFVIVALFLIIWYRLPGLLAVIALAVYTVIMLSLFKLIPVVMTAAGIAGFILSIGMAVDANILIFERMKEELRKGKTIEGAMHEGFTRAWPSIRDSNVSSLITATILFWMGTSLVKGFALTFGVGVVVSMFTAITVTRTFLYSLRPKETPLMKSLFSNGFSSKT